MFNELLTYDGPHLLQDLDTYLGEKEWLIGDSVSMFYIVKKKKYKYTHIDINTHIAKTHKDSLRKKSYPLRRNRLDSRDKS